MQLLAAVRDMATHCAPAQLALAYALQDAGIGYASLHRFVSGEWSISMDVFDKLCEALGLELRPGD